MPPSKKKVVKLDDTSIEDLTKLPARERFRIMNAERMAKKYPESAHVDDAKFLVIPDLGNQYALGRPGYCMGRINYLLAEEGASKTSRMLHLCGQALRQGGLAALVETEGEIDEAILEYYLGEHAEYFAKNCIKHPKTLEEGMEMSRDILRDFEATDPDRELVKVLGFDSVGGSVMARTLDDDREIGDTRVGGSGLYMSEAVKTIKHHCKKSGTLWVVLGQLKEKIETGFSGPPKAYLEKVTGLGGKALNFETAYWEILQRAGTLKDGDDKSGFRVKSTFKKNKRGVQWREYRYDIQFYQNLSGCAPTMEMLSIGSICGLKSKNFGSLGKRYWCEALQIDESGRLPIEEMYELIHRPENIGIFQDALGIKHDMSDMSELPTEEDVAEGGGKEKQAE